MAAFGSSNPFPRRFGAKRRPNTLERLALEATFLRETEPTGKPLHPTKAAEAYAFGRVVGSIWNISERLRGAEIPSRMIETLPTWEEILRTRPTAEDSDNERRTVVAAKLRGISGQATSEDIEAVCRTLLGSSFEGLARVDPTEELSYWPVINPGPPGFEWCSNRCSIGILVRRGPQSDGKWARLMSHLHDILETLLPAWEVFEVGTDDGGFVCDVGLPDVTML
jgi:hypothetical protein